MSCQGSHVDTEGDTHALIEEEAGAYVIDGDVRGNALNWKAPLVEALFKDDNRDSAGAKRRSECLHELPSAAVFSTSLSIF